MRMPWESARGLRDALGAVAAGGVGEKGAEAGARDGASDALVVGGDGDLVDVFRPRCTLGDPDHHRLPTDVGEGFARKPLGGVARGDDSCEAHVALYRSGTRVRNV